MKFSIITCTYNSEKFLKDNIESVKKQIFNDFEHIFIDGFSKDETIKIIKSYQKEFPNQVKIFQYPPKGIANAFNKGIKIHSLGEYLFFLNSDDYFYDEKILEDVNNFLESNNFDWIYGKINVIEENKKLVGIWPKHWYLHWNYKNPIGKYFLKFFNFIPHQGIFIKKNIFKKFSGFNENLASLMDIEFWLKIKDKTKWIYFNKIIANYRIRQGAQSSDIKNIKFNQNEHREIQNKHLNLLEKPIAFIVNKIIRIKSKKNFR